MKNENLIKWLTDQRADEYFGASFALRFAVLAAVVSGNGTIAAVGRRHGVSKQAAHRHAAKARRIFGIGSTACVGTP